MLPLRKVRENKEIESIINQSWEEGAEQLECVLRKNYLDMDGNAVFSEDDIKRFFNEFAIKEAEDIVKELSSVSDLR